MVFATELGIESGFLTPSGVRSPAPFSINGFARVWPLAFCVKVESGWNLAAGVLP